MQHSFNSRVFTEKTLWFDLSEKYGKMTSVSSNKIAAATKAKSNDMTVARRHGLHVFLLLKTRTYRIFIGYSNVAPQAKKRLIMLDIQLKA